MLGAVSHHYLKMLGIIVCGHMWGLMVLEAQKQLDVGEGNTQFLTNKIATGRFFMEQFLPDCVSLQQKIMKGTTALMGLSDEDI